MFALVSNFIVVAAACYNLFGIGTVCLNQTAAITPTVTPASVQVVLPTATPAPAKVAKVSVVTTTVATTSTQVSTSTAPMTQTAPVTVSDTITEVVPNPVTYCTPQGDAVQVSAKVWKLSASPDGDMPYGYISMDNGYVEITTADNVVHKFVVNPKSGRGAVVRADNAILIVAYTAMGISGINATACVSSAPIEVGLVASEIANKPGSWNVVFDGVEFKVLKK